jgi:hypothetical protein
VWAHAARIAFVEDEIEHMKDSVQSFGPLTIGWKTKGYTRCLDLLVRAADALRHRRLGNQERVGDFSGREAADGA